MVKLLITMFGICVTGAIFALFWMLLMIGFILKSL